jgi:hypothetical protein
VDLSEALRQFDGKQVKSLERLAVQLQKTPASIDQLLTLSGSDNPRMQTAATWILKRLQERGVSLTAAQSRDVFRLLGRVPHWEAKLHLLQMLGELKIPARNAARLFEIFETDTRDPNKLVRAWSYNGLSVIGEQHEKYRADVTALLENSQHDEAASVRARVRQIRKTSAWA